MRFGAQQQSESSEESSGEISILSEIAEATNPSQEFESEEGVAIAVSEPSSPHGIPFIRLGPVYDQENIVAEVNIEEDFGIIHSTHQRFKAIEDDFKLAVGDDSGCQLIVDDND